MRLRVTQDPPLGLVLVTVGKHGQYLVGDANGSCRTGRSGASPLLRPRPRPRAAPRGLHSSSRMTMVAYEPFGSSNVAR